MTKTLQLQFIPHTGWFYKMLKADQIQADYHKTSMTSNYLEEIWLAPHRTIKQQNQLGIKHIGMDIHPSVMSDQMKRKPDGTK